ncbi:heavy metal translocating P-type ATPase [Corynebacterium epidermidicanis]|uniref:Cation transport ATPase n=1 Tax=Corynebacterium epidermidicanis TaxID=1050174 RepID=A0A0G3GWW3_9CORY|nr:HAD family hydrolase [Corynebacterium epidermidicanis]AKK04043.1 cation transport ATPase [Corynebacterium epidermidicanis]
MQDTDQPLPEVPSKLRRSEQQMESAIAAAKEAAKQAGVTGTGDSEESPQLRLARRKGGAYTSFTLELEGLRSAVDVKAIEAELQSLKGVKASVVYESQTAWVTAPDDVNPDQIAEVFAAHGVKAFLTHASLRRRAERFEQQARTVAPTRKRKMPGLRRGSAQARRRREALQRDEQLARASGWLGSAALRERRDEDSTNVLFTARELLTRKRLIVSALLSLPVFLLCYIPALQFPYWQWVCATLATPVVTWGAYPFHRALAAGLRRGMSALDAASSVAVLSAYIWSLVLLCFTPAGAPGWRFAPQWLAYNYASMSSGELFLDVACGVTVFMLFGGLFIRRSRRGLLDDAASARRDYMTSVTVVRKDPATAKSVHVDIPLQEIREGDDIIVPGGYKIPVDGRVIGGAAEILPGLFSHYQGGVQQAKVNSIVHAGGLIKGGPLKIRVMKTGSQTRMAAIYRWIADATNSQNRSELLATKTASILVPWALGIAAVDFVLWWLITGNINSATASALAILAGVGPVALALSTQVAMRLGVEQTARKGMLLRDAEKIRELDEVDTVVFNRVGTLSKPDMMVATLTAADGENAELVMRVAGALSMESEHPVGKALVRASREARDSGAGGDEIPHWIEVSHPRMTESGDLVGSIEVPMKNSDGEIELRQTEAKLVRPRDLSGLPSRLATAAVGGGVPIVVSWKGKPRGVITLTYDSKDDAVDAIQQLESMDLETIMLTRDMYPVARRFADRLGMSKVLAGIALGRKAMAVRGVHTQGATVAMVGGLSVRECLRVADVGILMEPEFHLDIDEADVVLLREDVSVIPELMTLSKRVSALVDRNIWFSWAYNALVISAAVAGVLHPMAATLLTIGFTLFIEARSNAVRKF